MGWPEITIRNAMRTRTPDVVAKTGVGSALAPKKVVQGYSEQEVENIAADVARKTRRYWEDKAELYRFMAYGFEKAAEGMLEQGDFDKKSFKELAGEIAREAARKEDFDFNKAQNKFLIPEI